MGVACMQSRKINIFIILPSRAYNTNKNHFSGSTQKNRINDLKIPFNNARLANCPLLCCRNTDCQWIIITIQNSNMFLRYEVVPVGDIITFD
jgi:hypothetical protein